MVIRLWYDKGIIYKLIQVSTIYVIRKMDKKIYFVRTSTQHNEFLMIVLQQPHQN